MKKHNNRKIKSFKEIAGELVVKFNEHDLGAYIYHAATTGSCYIRFADSRMCSVRIGDHDGREKYKYKFNLRSDIHKSFYDKSEGTWRCYYSMNDTEKLIVDLLKRKEIIATWPEAEKKYEYKVPSFKKEINEKNNNQ